MDEFVSIVDSSPENEMPKQVVRKNKRLFIKGLLTGVGIALCIGGIIQHIIGRIYSQFINDSLQALWFGINIWSWLIGLAVLIFIAIRNMYGRV